jgi:multidrug resistance efflux pump
VVKAPPAAQHDPGLFRAEALKHRLSSEEGRGLVRVSPPWTWALLWIVVAGIGAALTASFVGEFEVTGRGRGILRPAAGVRVLTSQMTGTVVRVHAHSGDGVKAGATLLEIESATVQGQLLEAERELEAVRTRFSAVASQQDQHFEEQVQSLKDRASRLGDQIASLRSSEAHFKRRVDADLGLLRKGLVSDLALSETRDALAQAQRQLSGAEQALDQTRQELASLESRRQDELWQRQQTVSAAQNKRDALALVMRQSVIVAPEDGIVEALLVRVGETVQAGQAVGKVVPVSSPLHVVSFLAEKDRAFAKPGDEVELELDQLPHAEYGTLKAKVVRIGDDLASPSEIREAFGEGLKLEAPSYRVELAITDGHAAEAAGVKLRTGTLLNARFTLKRQKLITLVLNPLRKWFR